MFGDVSSASQANRARSSLQLRGAEVERHGNTFVDFIG
jgi:hypothetical protein